MTQYYAFIRREVYELKASRKCPKRRSIKEMIALFKPLNWILFILTMISILAIVIILIISLSVSDITIWAFIPTLFIGAAAMLSDAFSEKHIYRTSEREKEIEQEKIDLKSYLDEVKSIFDNYNLGKTEFNILKKECEERINQNTTKNRVLQNKIIDIMIIAPIAALISFVVNENNKINNNAIAIIIFLGVVILGLFKLFIPLQGIWNNTHKDQCLLDALRELEYINHFDGQKI